MDGYQYLIQRNKLMIQLEDDLSKLKDLPDPEREKETKRLQTKFDFALADLYAKVADEFPGRAGMLAYGFLVGLASSLMGVSGGSISNIVQTLYGAPPGAGRMLGREGGRDDG